MRGKGSLGKKYEKGIVYIVTAEVNLYIDWANRVRPALIKAIHLKSGNRIGFWSLLIGRFAEFRNPK